MWSGIHFLGHPLKRRAFLSLTATLAIMLSAIAVANEREALLAAIRANPDDDTPRLVYADWLDEHGEPERAGLIRTGCERERMAQDEARSGVSYGLTQWILIHQDKWVPEKVRKRLEVQGIHLSWVRGFPRVTMSARDLTHANLKLLATIPELLSVYVVGGTAGSVLGSHANHDAFLRLQNSSIAPRLAELGLEGFDFRTMPCDIRKFTALGVLDLKGSVLNAQVSALLDGHASPLPLKRLRIGGFSDNIVYRSTLLTIFSSNSLANLEELDIGSRLYQASFPKNSALHRLRSLKFFSSDSSTLETLFMSPLVDQLHELVADHRGVENRDKLLELFVRASPANITKLWFFEFEDDSRVKALMERNRARGYCTGFLGSMGGS